MVAIKTGDTYDYGMLADEETSSKVSGYFCGDDVVIKMFYVHRLAPHKLYLIVERFPERYP